MYPKKATLLTSLTTTLTLTLMTASVSALELNTGEPSGAYFKEFCPAIQTAAKEQGVELECKTSKGSINNLETVKQTPSQFGLSQYDVFSLKDKDQQSFTPIRDDIGKECLFMVTKNKLINNMGDIASSAPYMNFILPPEKSGHSGTFKYLQKIDPTGLGKATKITHAASTEDAITSTLTSEDSVTIFVQFPNPDNKFFKLVNENGGHFIPVISREILSQSIKGRKIYSAQSTEVTNPEWHQSGKELITACTPIVLFTGKSDSITDPDTQARHTNAITVLQQIPADKLRPKEGWFSQLWTSTKAVSAKSVEGLVEATEQAKKATSPYLEKAKEVTEDALEAAKPTYEKAVDKTKEALESAKPTYDKAVDKTKEALEAAKPTYDKAKEATKSYYQQAKELGWKAWDQTTKYFEKTKKPDETPPANSKPSE